MNQCYIDRFNKRCGTIFCHRNIMRLKVAAIFVGQNRNKINGISQYSNQVFENEEQLVNIYIGHIIQF